MKNEPARWLVDYQRDGFLVVPDCLDSSTLAKLRKGIEAITSNPEAVPARLKTHLFEREFVKTNPGQNEFSAQQVGNALRNIMELPLFDPVFAEFIVYPPLLDVLQALFGSGEFHFHNYKCIIKAPRISSKFVWHRDLPYLPHTGTNILTAMLCLDDMTEQNGATVVLPGTHRIADEQVKASDMDIPEKDLPDAPQVLVKCSAGSAVLFHVNIIHGGGANRSEVPRRNVIGIWAGPDTHPTTGAPYAYQGLMPRSADPTRRRQVQMSFPHLCKASRA